MKRLLLPFIFLVCSICAYAEKPIEYFSVGDPLKFDGTKYYLAWSAHPKDHYYTQEYLPKGESLDNFNSMLSVLVIFLDIPVSDMVQAKISELEQRKQNDPITNYKLFENDGEYLLDFIVSDSYTGDFNTVEVNVYHYQPATVNGKQAVILSFYSGRAYGDDITPFMLSIPKKREARYKGLLDLNLKPVFDDIQSSR
ncbi:MAG: hypothetical protein K2M19_04365 [Muribaculaceae bacterium]|nr:hypothetical protein [Muribaculaceae bacterium]